MRLARRSLLRSIGAAGVVGTAGCLGGETVTIDADGPPPETPISTVSIPEAPGEYDYETMGSGDDPTAIYFASWKCPSCAAFSEDLFEDIVEEFVAPGDLTIVHRGLGYGPNGDPFLGDDAPRISRAGLALWELDPESFWPYYKLVMGNQPAPDEAWGTTDTLVSLADAVGVEQLDAFRDAIDDEAYEQALEETAAAAARHQVGGTPWMVVGDQSFSPLEDSDATMSILEDAIE